MNLTITLLDIAEYKWLMPVLAALIPLLGFGAILLTVILRGKPKPKIITTKEAIRVVGISTQTTKATFLKDDNALWKEFKKLRESNFIKNKKEEHSFISVLKTSPDNKSWEYLIGCIVHDFSAVPEGAKIFEVPADSYAAFHVDVVKNHRKWAAMRMKMEKYIHEKWLPKSNFQLDANSPVREIEYHEKATSKDTLKMIFYVPVKPKGK